MAIEARLGERVTTGIPGLDPILEGGLLPGGVYLVEGTPGSGKTIFANQMCFHHAATGGRAVYFTLLAETHSRMLGHLRRMSFFRNEIIGDSLVFLSAYKVLEEDGLPALTALFRDTVVEREATLLVVDGLMTAAESSSSSRELKSFVHAVQVFANSLGCTTLLLSSSDPSATTRPEHTIVDGVIELYDDVRGLRPLRHLQVRKQRGSRQVRGRHTLEITDRGLTVHPRFEVGLGREAPRAPDAERRAFGVPGLDKMLHGGVPRGSVTMLLGAAGSGKTLLQLRFLAEGAAQGERGLYFGMYEHSTELLAKCARVGVGVRDGIDAGLIELVWERPIEGILDIVTDLLFERLRETRASRLCLDGLNSLFQTIDSVERNNAVAAALAERLDLLGVTTLFTLESPELVSTVGSPVRVPLENISAMSQNVIAIRNLERGTHVQRMISVLKMRDSAHDARHHELLITDRGIVVAARGSRERRG